MHPRWVAYPNIFTSLDFYLTNCFLPNPLVTFEKAKQQQFLADRSTFLSSAIPPVDVVDPTAWKTISKP
jgi:hypothetical protein